MLRNLGALAAGVILGGFSIWGVTQLYESVRGYSWPHVNGTVISSAARSERMNSGKGGWISHWPEVRYEYIVGNRHVTADRIRFIVRGMNEKETQRVVGSYPVGKAVTVYYDPRGCDGLSSGARNLVADDPDTSVVNNADLAHASDHLFRLPQAEVKNAQVEEKEALHRAGTAHHTSIATFDWILDAPQPGARWQKHSLSGGAGQRQLVDAGRLRVTRERIDA